MSTRSGGRPSDTSPAYDPRMDATSGRSREWNAAVDLVGAVADGAGLPRIPSPVLLDVGEVLHADLPAEGWRFHGADITYAAPHVVAVGGPLMFGIVAAASATARRRARRHAEAMAAAQWRPLGPLRILATDRRLLVWHEGAWASVWYNAICELQPHLEVGRLDMTFENDPPYCLSGPWVPYLTVIICVSVRGSANAAVARHASGAFKICSTG